MKKITIMSLFSLALLFSACSFYWDDVYGIPYRPIRVTFHVEPDDAQILLNGRFIGEAFEYSLPESALRLQSRNHEIIIKKKGYSEEVINLQQYLTRDISIELKMKEIKPLSEEIKKEESAGEAKKPEYVAKTAPVKEPVLAIKPEEEVMIQTITLFVEIQPADSAIYLNGKFWGIVPEAGKIENLRLKPGQYTIEVVKPGYKSVKKIIELKDQKQITVTINLEKKDQDDALIL